MKQKTLRLAVNAEYFDTMKSGEKVEEYRLINPFWTTRLMGRDYDRLVITKGYPRKFDAERHITMPYRGYEVKTITHKHFGPDPVRVFAIKVQLEDA